MRRVFTFAGRSALVAALLGAVLVCSEPAMAQTATGPTPPTPNREDTPPTKRSFLLALLIAAACVGANAIPSKRGHQD